MHFFRDPSFLSATTLVVALALFPRSAQAGWKTVSLSGAGGIQSSQAVSNSESSASDASSTGASGAGGIGISANDDHSMISVRLQYETFGSISGATPFDFGRGLLGLSSSQSNLVVDYRWTNHALGSDTPVILSVRGTGLGALSNWTLTGADETGAATSISSSVAIGGVDAAGSLIFDFSSADQSFHVDLDVGGSFRVVGGDPEFAALALGAPADTSMLLYGGYLNLTMRLGALEGFGRASILTAPAPIDGLTGFQLVFGATIKGNVVNLSDLLGGAGYAPPIAPNSPAKSDPL